MKITNKFSRNTVNYIAVIGIGLFILLGSIQYVRSIYEIEKVRVMHSLEVISSDNVKLLEKEIQKDMIFLKNVATLLSAVDSTEMAYKLNLLNELVEINPFKRMGIIELAGLAYTTDGLYMDLSDREYFKKALKGKDSVTDTLQDFADEEKINVFSVPVIDDDTKQVTSVLFATLSTENFQAALSSTNYNNTSYTYVVKRDGTRVTGSDNPESIQEFDNVLVALLECSEKNKYVAEQLKKGMQSGGSGYFEFDNQVSKYMYYQPLGTNDWYTLTVVPTSVIRQDANTMLIRIYIYVTTCIVLFALMYLLIFRMRTTNIKDLENMAYVDTLTKGDTYQKFKLEAYKYLEKYQDKQYALVYMNVVKFRQINDIYGYDEGKNVLQYIFNILNEQRLEKSELLTRVNEDHFVLLMEMKNRAALSERIEYIEQKLKVHSDYKGNAYTIAIATGICEIEKGFKDIDTLVDRAVIALNSSENSMETDYAFYDEEMRKQLFWTKSIEDRFQIALQQGEFQVYYQPELHIKTEEFDAAEALVRWFTKDGACISPADFIPILEKNGQILELDEYIFKQVCHQIRTWLDKGLEVTPISVNISRIHIQQKNFVERYLEILKNADIPSEFIRLELTETVLFENDELLTGVLGVLHQAGIMVLMDDFGSGYSSIKMLKDIPVDILKLDKGLLDDLETNERGRKVVKHLIATVQELHMEVIAEGIETKSQFEFLKQAGCDYIQGYYCARPMAGKDFEVLLKNRGQSE